MSGRRRKIEVSWTRSRSSDGGRSRPAIRIREERGDWREVNSLDELPASVREMIDDLISRRAAAGENPPPGDSTEEGRQVEGSPIRDAAEVMRHNERMEPRLGRPRRVRKTERRGSLRLEHVWCDGCAVAMSVFGSVGMLYYGIADYRKDSDLSGIEQIAAVFLLLGCIGIAYFGIATLLNRTVITIADGRLKVHHGPIPWPGNREFDVNDVEQLYCAAYDAGRNTSGLRWSLRAAGGFGKVTLLDNIRHKSEAVDLELAIERHLGIPDWPRYED